MESSVKSAADWQALITEKEHEIADLRQQVDWLTQQFRLMQSRRFGASSEKTATISEQISLFGETEANDDISEPESEQITYKRKKQKGKRELDFSGLPTEQIVHELPESERFCPECGNGMHAFGHEIFRRELTFIPAKYKVTEHVQTAYSCRHCERTGDHVHVKKSNVPAALIPGSGVASPSLLANILNNKYVMALPLYRQEQELMRMGINISRQTMSNWIITLHQRYFAGFFRILHRELIKNTILHADETTLMVLREDGREARQKSYVWLYSTSGDSKRPVILYDYKPSRAGEWASNFLTGFTGKLHTDGYDAQAAAGDYCRGLLGAHAAEVYRRIENPAAGNTQ